MVSPLGVDLSLGEEDGGAQGDAGEDE